MMLRTHSVFIGLMLSGRLVLGLHAADGKTSTANPAGVVSSRDGRASANSAVGTAAPQENSSKADTNKASQNDDVTKLLESSNAHLDTGRQLYFQGNIAGAKREFDAAVNVLLSAPDSLSNRDRVERRLDEVCDLIYRFDVEKLGAGEQDESAVVFDKAPIDEVSHMTFPVDETLKPRLRTELDQTASGIPLELSEPVLSYVQFFSTDRGRSILLAGFKRAGRYRPMIEKIFAEEGVPQELVYLAQAESGFLPRALSYKNAVGMWQFIAGTGSQYDLVHTSTFDERLDPEKSTRAAAKYLKDLYSRYGDWYLAMAAYNCGAGAVDRAVERTGYADYWELLKRHALPKETSNYVPIIVAMTIIAKNPHDYGLEKIEVDQPLEYDTLQLTASTSLDLIADATLQPISSIRELNPALLKAVVPSGLLVKIPKGSKEAAEAALETVPAANRNAWRLHRVEHGDTLEAIAKSYHLPAQRIMAVNRGVDSLEAGNVLLIPAVYHQEKQPAQQFSKVRGHRRVAKSGRGALTRSAHVAASRRAAAQTIHRRTTVHSVGLAE